MITHSPSFRILITLFALHAAWALSSADAVASTPQQVDLKPDVLTEKLETPTQQASEPNLTPSDKLLPNERISPAVPEESEALEMPTEPEKFIPFGGISHLDKPLTKDLFTKGKSVGHVQDNPKLPYRRLVQRTIMPTEPLPSYGVVLTFDDQLVADSPNAGNAIDIVNDLAPLGARAIFFANVNGLSETNVHLILRHNNTTEKRIEACNLLLNSKHQEFVTTIRELLKVQGPPDDQGNRQYTCEVFNHTAFHQDMSRLKVGSDKHTLCLLGITFIEQCLDEAYAAERPDWQRARYFRFPFLHTPKDNASQKALNEKFTELGLVAVGETQDSKDVDNYSSRLAKRSLEAAKQHKRYNPRYGVYGETDSPIALFHTKTWNKIKPGVISYIKENK